MADNFQRGDLLPIYYQPLNGGNSRLNITGYSFDEECLRHDVTHTGHNGRTARLRGKGDHKGTITVNFDLDAPPYDNPPNIRAGESGRIGFAVDASNPSTNPVYVPVIIAKVHYETAVEGYLKYSFDVEENVLAGNLNYP